PPGPESSSSAWRVCASGDRGGAPAATAFVGRGVSSPPVPDAEKCATPWTIGYSRWHAGHPSKPDRTIRPTISPVDSTRNASSCASGQRSISVSSMCTGTEHDPRHAASLDADPAGEPLAVDQHRQGIIALLDVAHGEVLPIRGIGMVVLAVRLRVRERRLLRLGFHEPVHARLRHGATLGVPHLPRDDPRAGQRADRSEERRVGKECRTRWAAYHEKNKKKRHDETTKMR